MTTTNAELRQLYAAALSYTERLTGKARDRAIFDFLAGASAALYGPQHCPPWLFVIGARGGYRVDELQHEIARLDRAAADAEGIAADAVAQEAMDAEGIQ